MKKFKKLKSNPLRLLSNADEVVRRVSNIPELILTYPPSREIDVVTFWNHNIDDFNDIMADYSDIIDMNTVTLAYSDNKRKPPGYNLDPKNTISRMENDGNNSFIDISLQNVSTTVHEFNHVLDIKPDEPYSQRNNFKPIVDAIKTDYLELCKRLNISTSSFVLNQTQQIYECSEDEVFARLINNHYLKTRGDNIYANQLKPQLMDYVLDIKYEVDLKFREEVDTFLETIPELSRWGDVQRGLVVSSNYVTQQEELLLFDTLTQLTETQLTETPDLNLSY